MRLIFVKLTSKLQKFLGKHGIRVEQIATIENLRFRSWQLDSIQIWNKSAVFCPIPTSKAPNIHTKGWFPPEWISVPAEYI